MSLETNASYTTLPTFVIRETPSSSAINAVSNNPSSNIILVGIGEIKLKIKDSNLFYKDRSRYKSYNY
jgi:hypothetical protein